MWMASGYERVYITESNRASLPFALRKLFVHLVNGSAVQRNHLHVIVSTIPSTSCTVLHTRAAQCILNINAHPPGRIFEN